MSCHYFYYKIGDITNEYWYNRQEGKRFGLFPVKLDHNYCRTAVAYKHGWFYCEF